MLVNIYYNLFVYVKTKNLKSAYGQIKKKKNHIDFTIFLQVKVKY